MKKRISITAICLAILLSLVSLSFIAPMCGQKETQVAKAEEDLILLDDFNFSTEIEADINYNTTSQTTTKSGAMSDFFDMTKHENFASDSNYYFKGRYFSAGSGIRMSRIVEYCKSHDATKNCAILSTSIMTKGGAISIPENSMKFDLNFKFSDNFDKQVKQIQLTTMFSKYPSGTFYIAKSDSDGNSKIISDQIALTEGKTSLSTFVFDIFDTEIPEKNFSLCFDIPDGPITGSQYYIYLKELKVYGSEKSQSKTANDIAKDFNMYMSGGKKEIEFGSIVFNRSEEDVLIEDWKDLGNICEKGSEYIATLNDMAQSSSTLHLSQYGLKFQTDFDKIGSEKNPGVLIYLNLISTEQSEEKFSKIKIRYFSQLGSGVKTSSNKLTIYKSYPSEENIIFSNILEQSSVVETKTYEMAGQNLGSFLIYGHQFATAYISTVTISSITFYKNTFCEGICDPQGVNTNTEELKNNWNNKFAADYASLSDDEKSKFEEPIIDEDIHIMVEKYDYVYWKYHASLGLTDFLERGIRPPTNVNTNQMNFSQRLFETIGCGDSTIGLVVFIVAIVSVSSVGTFLILRKKKHE